MPRKPFEEKRIAMVTTAAENPAYPNFLSNPDTPFKKAGCLIKLLRSYY